jgi:hypothetical protein
MKISTTSLLALLAIGSAALFADSVSAGGFSFGGGGGNGGGGGGFKFHTGNQKGGHYDQHSHHQHYKTKKYYSPSTVGYSQSYRPYWNSCFVLPGDTWITISKRSYGYSGLGKYVARYNNLSTSNSQLTPGRKLRLPVIGRNGSLLASNAPAPPRFQPPMFGPQGLRLAEQGLPAATKSNVAQDADAGPLVSIGSSLALDGKSFGKESGNVRLRISGLVLPVAVLQWSDDSIKSQLPKVELIETTQATLEVLRADGKVASTSPVRLTPAETRLALGN